MLLIKLNLLNIEEMFKSNIKPLPKLLTRKGEVKGYDFLQIRQADKAFIYEVSSGNRKHYEVFKKIVNRRYACVSYPTAMGFGIWAWNYMKIKKARKKFDELNQ